MWLAALALLAWTPVAPPPCGRGVGVQMMAKGFGKPSPKQQPAKAAKKPPSEASARRNKAAKDFDNLKASGAPEYMVLVREAPDGREPGKWYPVGGIAVPRSSSEDQALSIAIFNNEDDLLKGAFRAYPFLKNSQEKFECEPRRAAPTIRPHADARASPPLAQQPASTHRPILARRRVPPEGVP